MNIVNLVLKDVTYGDLDLAIADNVLFERMENVT